MSSASHLAEKCITHCTETALRLAVAESCTGGLVAAALTAIPGASAVLERGFVTYSNLAKMEMLGVEASLIETYGAVSEAVAQAMARGALLYSQADCSVAITGIAGPSGGTAEKPVGLVFIATATRSGQVRCERYHFPGDREHIRMASVAQALELLYDTACIS